MLAQTKVESIVKKQESSDLIRESSTYDVSPDTKLINMVSTQHDSELINLVKHTKVPVTEKKEVVKVDQDIQTEQRPPLTIQKLPSRKLN